MIDAFASAWLRFMRERAIAGLLVLVVVVAVALLVRVATRRRGSPHLLSALLFIALVPLVLPVERLVPSNWIPRRVGAALAVLDPATPQPLRGRLPDLPTLRAGPAERAPTPAATSAAATPTARAAFEAPSLATLLFAAWSLATLALLLRLVRSHLRTRASLARATPVARDELPATAAHLANCAGLVRAPPIVTSAELPAPATCGVLRPVVVLPAGLRGELGGDGLRFVLLHEFAHVRRRDPLLALLERLVRVAWFFHPTAWLLGAWLSRERERACDDAAICQLPQSARGACAEALLSVVERASRRISGPAAALALSSGGRAMKDRLLRIVDSRPASARMSARTRAAFCAAVAAMLLVLAARVAPQTAPVVAPTTVVANAPANSQAADAPSGPAGLADAKTALHAGLAWLLRHQESDGRFSAHSFDERCKDPACKGAGDEKVDIGVTALAASALMGSGDETSAPAIERALDWLVAQQDAKTGQIGPKGKPWTHAHYDHVYATVALVDGFGLEQKEKWKEPARKAIDYLLRARNPYSGWRYGRTDGDNDSSLTGTIVYVLAGARNAGFTIDDAALQGGLDFLRNTTDPESGRTGYQQRGGFPSRTVEGMSRFPATASESTTAIALNALLQAGRSGDASALREKQVALLMAQPPHWDDHGGGTDFYYWYYGTRALFLARGDAWNRWKDAIVRELVPHQSKEGHAAGSFPPVDAWSDLGGRVYATALNLLTLEICCRDR